jgi:hypothetical protein
MKTRSQSFNNDVSYLSMQVVFLHDQHNKKSDKPSVKKHRTSLQPNIYNFTTTASPFPENTSSLRRTNVVSVPTKSIFNHDQGVITRSKSNILSVGYSSQSTIFTHLKMYNGTPKQPHKDCKVASDAYRPEGSPTRGSRATSLRDNCVKHYPINELKTDCPISNIHRSNSYDMYPSRYSERLRRRNQMYDVDIDFDESSRAWLANKQKIGNGCFSYK